MPHNIDRAEVERNEYGPDTCPKCSAGLYCCKTKALGAVFECGSSLKDGVFEQDTPCLLDQLRADNARLQKRIDNWVDITDEVADLSNEIERLRNTIRRHRDYRGDDRCWMDDEELYAVLPEGYAPPARDTEIELENCKKYLECRRHPATIYMSPQRRIEELEADNTRLRAALEPFSVEAVVYSSSVPDTRRIQFELEHFRNARKALEQQGGSYERPN